MLSPSSSPSSSFWLTLLLLSMLMVLAAHGQAPVSLTGAHVVLFLATPLLPLLSLAPTPRWDPRRLWLLWGVGGVLLTGLMIDLFGHDLPELVAADGGERSQGPALLMRFLPLVVAMMAVEAWVEKVKDRRAPRALASPSSPRV